MRLFLLWSLLFFAFPPRIQAYLDPGAGSYITQLVIGFAVGGMYMARGYLTKIRVWLMKLKEKRAADGQE